VNSLRRGRVQSVMLLRSLAVAVAVVLLAPSAAVADVPKPAPTPCVNRGGGLLRPIHDVVLDDKTLAFCTGDDCWMLDRATHTVAAAPKVTPAPEPPRDPAGTLGDGKGATLATADKAHVEFCPRRTGGAPACKSFPLAFKTPAASVRPAMNAAGTLGAVVYRGSAEPDDADHGPSYVAAFDLVKGKQLGALAGGDVVVLDRGFVVDSAKIYNAALKPIGKLAAYDEVWIKVGPSTDLIALRDKTTGELVLQNTRTARLVARIPLGAADPTTYFRLVATPDGAMVYAIGGVEDEGDIVVIDAAHGKLVTHASAPVCAPGTMRRI